MNKTSNKIKKIYYCLRVLLPSLEKYFWMGRFFVRLLVDSGGCSGFSYKFSVDKNIDHSNDIILLEEENKNMLLLTKYLLIILKILL